MDGGCGLAGGDFSGRTIGCVRGGVETRVAGRANGTSNAPMGEETRLVKQWPRRRSMF